ncbi:hypothetical protein VUR80DRAFT_10133 [Thermomyces stellatus]
MMLVLPCTATLRTYIIVAAGVVRTAISGVALGEHVRRKSINSCSLTEADSTTAAWPAVNPSISRARPSRDESWKGMTRLRHLAQSTAMAEESRTLNDLDENAWQSSIEQLGTSSAVPRTTKKTISSRRKIPNAPDSSSLSTRSFTREPPWVYLACVGTQATIPRTESNSRRAGQHEPAPRRRMSRPYFS